MGKFSNQWHIPITRWKLIDKARHMCGDMALTHPLYKELRLYCHHQYKNYSLGVIRCKRCGGYRIIPIRKGIKADAYNNSSRS